MLPLWPRKADRDRLPLADARVHRDGVAELPARAPAQIQDVYKRQGFATKTYGGAILGNSTKTDLSYTIRNKTNVDAKTCLLYTSLRALARAGEEHARRRAFDRTELRMRFGTELVGIHAGGQHRAERARRGIRLD